MDKVRHQHSTGTTNRRNAELIARKIFEDANLRRFQAPLFNPDMLFRELSERFLARGRSRPHHESRLKQLLPYFSQHPIGRIKRGMTDDYRQWRHEGKKVSDTTINRDLEVLRTMLNWSVDEGFLVQNPLGRLRLARERRKPRLVISVEEERRLLQFAAPHLRIIVIAALDTGTRRGELLQQRWEHVDFARQLLFVTKSKTAEGESREIPLSARLVNLLWENRKESGPIFTFNGNPISGLKTAWKGAIRRSGIRHYRFHDLRHGFNSRLMLAGVQVEIRRALMGHSGGGDINSIYTHVELPAKQEAIRKLEKWVRMQALKSVNEGPCGPSASDSPWNAHHSGIALEC